MASISNGIKVPVKAWLQWILYTACDLKGKLTKTKDGFIHGENHYGYVLGLKGVVYTEALAKECAIKNPTEKTYFLKSCWLWLNRIVLDCSGLLTVAVAKVLNIVFRAQKADYIFSHAVVRGNMQSLPEIPGVQLHKNGHTGVYIGKDAKGVKWAVESRGHLSGVVMSPVSSQPWTGWSKPDFVDYTELWFPEIPMLEVQPVTPPPAPMLKYPSWYTEKRYLRPGDKSDKVSRLQQELQKRGFFPKSSKCTGLYGPVTKSAVKKAQAAMGLKGKDVDGIFGDQTAAEWQKHYPN